MKIAQQVATAIRHFKKLTVGQLILTVVSVIFVAGGGTGQLIALNLWIDSFPSPSSGSGSGAGSETTSTSASSMSPTTSDMFSQSASSVADLTSSSNSSSRNAGPGVPRINPPFCILTLGAVTQALVYMSFFSIYTLVKRPRLGFLCTWKSVYLSASIGVTVAINGILLVSATGPTPELLQAFLLSTIVLWTFLFVKVIFAEKRSYISPLVLLSFALSLGGVIVGSAGSFKASGMNKQTIYWSLLFAGGMIPGALTAVMSSKYMRHFEEPEGMKATEEAHLLGGAEEEEMLQIRKVTTDANTSKYAMLCFGNLWQSFFMFFLMPLGALPWFGVSKDLGDLFEGVANGYKCTFNGIEGCDDVWRYFLLFNMSFIFSNIGSMFLNYYSPAINSMVSQLSAPLAALVLLIAPAWNPHKHKGKKNLGFNIAAIFLIVAGSIVYSMWEESTRNKAAGKHTVSGRSLEDNEAEGEQQAYTTQYNEEKGF